MVKGQRLQDLCLCILDTNLICEKNVCRKEA